MPLARVYFVPDHGREVHAEFGHIDRDLVGGLGGVGVEQRTVGVGDPGELGLQGSGLGVGEHDADQWWCRR